MRPSAQRAAWWIRAALIVVFLFWFAQFYRQGFGFTSVLMFNERRAAARVAHLRDVPVYVHPGAGYDGMFYAQLAVDPLLRDPSIDSALDSAPFRARRILFSWTAWALGLGQPAWILQAYAVQNVLCWLVLAWWLSHRFPGAGARDLAGWVACLFTPGLLDSARLALVDGPSLLLLAIGVEGIERGRFWIGSAVLGVAGLARETNLLAGAALVPGRLSRAGLLRLCGGAVLLLLPSLVWFDYLRSIYRSTVTASIDQLSAPWVAYAGAWENAMTTAGEAGWLSPGVLPLLALAGITLQSAWLIGMAVWRWRHPWVRVGIAFVALLLVVKSEIWLGAYLRVLLPLTLAFNLLLPGGRLFWPVFVAGNLGLATSAYLLLGRPAW